MPPPTAPTSPRPPRSTKPAATTGPSSTATKKATPSKAAGSSSSTNNRPASLSSRAPPTSSQKKPADQDADDANKRKPASQQLIVDPSWYQLPSLPATIKGSARAPQSTRWVSLHCRSPNMPADTIIRVPPTVTIDYVKEKLAQHHGGTVARIEIYKSLHRGDRIDEKSLIKGRTNAMTVREAWGLDEVEHDAVQIPANSGFASSNVFGMSAGLGGGAGGANCSSIYGGSNIYGAMSGRRKTRLGSVHPGSLHARSVSIDELNGNGNGMIQQPSSSGSIMMMANNNNINNRSMSPQSNNNISQFASVLGSPLSATTGRRQNPPQTTILVNSSSSNERKVDSNSNSPIHASPSAAHYQQHSNQQYGYTNTRASSLSPTTLNGNTNSNFFGGMAQTMSSMMMTNTQQQPQQQSQQQGMGGAAANNGGALTVSFASPNSGFPTGGYYVTDSTSRSPFRRIPSAARESPDRGHHLTSHLTNHNNSNSNNNNDNSTALLGNSALQQITSSSTMAIGRQNRFGSDLLSLSESQSQPSLQSLQQQQQNQNQTSSSSGVINVQDDHVILYYVFGPHDFASPLLFW